MRLLLLASLACSFDQLDQESLQSARCFEMARYAKDGLYDEAQYVRCLRGHAMAADAGADD